MIEQGKVVKIENNIADVEFVSSVNCQKCSACLTVAPGKRSVSAINKVNAKVGDEVRVNIPENKIGAGLILYMVPLLTFFLFLMIGLDISENNSEPIAALFGFSGMILSYFIIKFFTRNIKTKSFIFEII